MAKQEAIPSIYDIAKFIKPDKLLPVYFFCGEDGFTIDNAVKAVEKACEPVVENEFDKVVINLDKSSAFASVVDVALGFPFGGGKKVVIARNFETVKDKLTLVNYLANPAEFTVLIITMPQDLSRSDVEKDPYKTLLAKGLLFKAGQLKGEALESWLVKHAKKMGLALSQENSRALIEISGEDKALLEMQIRKFYDFLGEKGEITLELIKKMASTTKEYSIFDLQDALSARKKGRAIEIAFNLIDCGSEIIQIIGMLTKYLRTIAQAMEMARDRINDDQAFKMLKISKFYYLGCKKGTHFMNLKSLNRAADALYNADLAVKSSAMDHKAILMVLITEMLGESNS